MPIGLCWQSMEFRPDSSEKAPLLGFGALQAGGSLEHVKIMWWDGYSKWRCRREDGTNSEFFPTGWFPYPRHRWTPCYLSA